MSYDMSIGDESFNYTYNVSAMWYAAMPAIGIRAHYGLSGKSAITPLRYIRGYMEDHREELIELDPENGWGDYDGAVEFVSSLIMASIRNPAEVWTGD